MYQENTGNNKVINIIKKMGTIRELPTLPHIATQLLQMTNSDKFSLPEIGKVIEQDPSLSANIIKMANSPFFGVRHYVTDITKALVLLGVNETVSLASGLLVFRVFSNPGTDSSFDRKAFWLHSASCAMIARKIARTINAYCKGEEFLAGLLHDIGKIVLDEYFHEDFVTAVNLADSANISLRDAEVRVLGVSHDQIGGWLAEKWNLPPRIISAIKYHHTPEVLQNPVLAGIVNAANTICKTCGLGDSGYSHGHDFSDDAGWCVLQKHFHSLDNDDIEQVIEKVCQESDKAQDFIRHMRSVG